MRLLDPAGGGEKEDVLKKLAACNGPPVSIRFSRDQKRNCGPKVTRRLLWAPLMK